MNVLFASTSLLLVIAIRTVKSVGNVCGRTPDVNFASVVEISDHTYSVGTIATYRCQLGYVALGRTGKIRCYKSGEDAVWTAPEFECMPQSCGDPGYLTNGHRVGFLFTFPNSVTYHCDTGYNIRGIQTLYCQASGTWSGGLPECEVVKCGPPNNPENGQVTASSLEYGSELSYRCDRGFVLSTGETIYCTENGSWSRTDVTCNEIVCETPEKPQNGNVRFLSTEGRLRAGSTAIFSCEGDRVASGPTTSQCLESGVWASPPPECLEPCRIPDVSNGAIVKDVRQEYYGPKVYRQIEVGKRVKDYEELFLVCSEGFEEVGSGKRITKIYCSGGKWSLEPLCKPASCKANVPSAYNAEVVDINREHGGAVSYACSPDYRKVTHETLICDHGVWKGDAPVCKSTICSVATLTNLGLSKSAKYFYREGEVFKVKCDHRYHLAEGHSGELICEDGTWRGDLHPCIATNCSDPAPSIEHGAVEDPNKMTHGTVVKYVCDYPYVLEERSVVRCDFGRWTGQPPRCKDSRCNLKDLRKLDHVSRESPSFTFSGDWASIICEDGYTAESRKPFCRNGTWNSQHLSLCKESGCTVPRIFKGSVKEQKLGRNIRTSSGWAPSVKYIAVHEGATVLSRDGLWLFCDKPHTVLGDGRDRAPITCVKGRWSTDLQCLLDEGGYVPSTAEPASVHFTSTLAPSRSSSATTANYIPSSTPRSSRDVNCSSPGNVDKEKIHGVVSTSVPTEPPVEECFCKYPVEDSRVIAQSEGKKLMHGDKVPNGSFVEFRCLHVGYDRFRGRRNITCSDCQEWHSSDFPSCIEPEKRDAVILLSSDSNVLADGTVELLKGKALNLTCAALESVPKWNAPKVPGISFGKGSDRKEEGDIVHFTHLEIENADYEHEGTYECSVEVKRETSIRIIVTDPDLRCPEIPERDEIVIKYKMERRERSKASFSCPKKGQELVGRQHLTCLRSGKWSDSPPYCSGRCRLKDLRNLDHVSLKSLSFTLSGDRASIVCEDGYTAESRMPLCRNGTWDSQHLSLCKESDCTIPGIHRGSVKEQKLGEWNWTRSGWVQALNYLTIPQGTIISSRDVLWFFCDKPHTVLGDGRERAEVRCFKGKWSTDLTCLRGTECGKLNSTDLLQIHYLNDQEVGSIATFQCPSAAKRIGASFAKCLENGTWSQPTPVCEYLRCVVHKLKSSLPEGVVLASNTKNTSFPYNSTVKLRCKDDHKRLEGNSEARCAEEGEWKFGLIQCESNCKFPRKPPGSKLILSPERTEYGIGERLTFSCPPGMSLTTGSQVIMCLSSGWSETVLPDCERNESQDFQRLETHQQASVD